MLGASCLNWAALSPITSPRRSSWCQASTSLRDPFNPGPSTNEAANGQRPLLASHRAKAQQLSMTPSCLQNQSHLGDSYTSPSPAASTRYNLGHLWNTRSEETLPRSFHLSNAGLFLIAANSPAPVDQNHRILILDSKCPQSSL